MYINVLIRDEKSLIVDVLKIKYDSKIINNLDELNEYLLKNYSNEPSYYCCEYEIESKKKCCYFLSKKRKKLVLKQDFYGLSFDKYFKVTNNSVLTINAFLIEYGSESLENILSIMNTLSSIKDIISILLFLIVKIIYYLFPYYFIKEKYGYGKQFVSGIINYSKKWDYGFIKLKNIKNKKIIECSIMRKLKYKRIGNSWVRKYDLNAEEELFKYEIL